MLRFALSSLVAFLALGLLVSSVVSSLIRHRAEDAARGHARYVTEAVLGTALTPSDLAVPVTPGSARYEALLSLVRNRILRVSFPVVRIKIWRSDGTVLFSDEPRLVGRRYSVDGDLREAFAGQVASDVTNLSGARERLGSRAGLTTV